MTKKKEYKPVQTVITHFTVDSIEKIGSFTPDDGDEVHGYDVVVSFDMPVRLKVWGDKAQVMEPGSKVIANITAPTIKQLQTM